MLNYGKEAGAAVADMLVNVMAKNLPDLERNPSIGSPILGKLLGFEELSTWLLQGFPLKFWFLERANHVEIVRLFGRCQEPGEVEV